jgi:antitoxin component of RelBE/YafQ-DinJ toxin-antitoxin module
MIVCNKGLPFEVIIPNDETLAAMEAAERLNGDFFSQESDSGGSLKKNTRRKKT